MKSVLRIIVLLIVAVVCTIPVYAKDETPGVPLSCDTVIQVKDVSATQIYTSLRTWFADYMRSANSVIQLEDATNNHLIGKCNFDFTVNNITWKSLTGVIRVTIDVAARDGRFRVKIYDFQHEAFMNGWSEGIVYTGGPNPNISGIRKKQNSEMQKRAEPICKVNIAAILASMQEAVAAPSSAADDEW